MSASSPTRLVNLQGQPLQIVLYMLKTCPFCRRVQDASAALGLVLQERDLNADPEARAELMRVGGRATVPCLFINGQPKYESSDIITYLQKEVRAAG